MTLPIGEQIRAWRTELGWTQKQLAKKAGKHQQSISSLEAGKSPSLSTLERVAKALGAKLVVRLE